MPVYANSLPPSALDAGAVQNVWATGDGNLTSGTKTQRVAVVEQESGWNPWAMRYEPAFFSKYVAPLSPAPYSDESDSGAGKRVVMAIFALGILCAISLGIYRWFLSASTGQEKVRIAVLPFTYVSGDSRPDYITAGLTDLIRTKLGQLDPPHLGVIAATSSRIVAGQPIPEIGRVLNVKYLLEGGVQRAGDQVRIDVQLIQVSDQTHLWSESFTRELSDVLQVESDVSASIARQILATLPLPPQPAPSLQPGTVHAATPEIANSRHAFLQGEFAWGSRGDLRSSIAFFEQAIHDDPNYAEAYAGLAAATAILGQVPNDGLPPGEAKPKAKEAAQRALQLNPKLAEPHAVLGNVAMSYDWDLGTAERELRRAIELAPNDPIPHEWYCHLLIVEGHNSQALAEAHRALDLDPVSPLFHDVVAETYYFGRSYDAAIEEAQQVVKLHPGDLSAQFWLGPRIARKKCTRKPSRLSSTRVKPRAIIPPCLWLTVMPRRWQEMPPKRERPSRSCSNKRLPGSSRICTRRPSTLDWGKKTKASDC